MSRTVTMLRYRFVESIWRSSISKPDIAQRLGRAFQGSRLFGEEGRQYGFIDCRFLDNIVFGYFAQEGAKEIIGYDDNVRRETRNIGSFAHILFALHVESGIVALQKTRVVGFVDLNILSMRTQFPIAVEELMQSIQIPVIRLVLEPDKTEITTEQLYSIFINYKTTSLNVVNLKGRPIPSYEEFKIFNPRVDQDLVYRQIFGEDTQNLDSLMLQAHETDDLRETALARLASRVGDVRAVTVDPRENGQGVRFTTTISDKFKVTVSSDNEKQPIQDEDIREIIHPLTLTLTLQGVQGDVSQLLNSLLSFANFMVDDDDDNDE